jgi:multiple sugar transport system permease protein
MRVTATFVVLDVSLTILVALGLAILLLRQGFGTSILRTLLILPFAMSPALIGISWRFMLNPDYGAFNRTIAAILPFMRNTDYLASPTFAMGALISADVWHWAPYFTFMLMGGLASIPPETQEAARIDGASNWRVFRDVTLPQLAPVLAIAVILKSVFALKVFDSIVTMTGGGPGRSTTTLAFFAYHIGFRDYDFGYAAAVAYVLTAMLFMLSLFYMRFAFRRAA